jgi:hypothetical protein
MGWSHIKESVNKYLGFLTEGPFLSPQPFFLTKHTHLITFYPRFIERTFVENGFSKGFVILL